MANTGSISASVINIRNMQPIANAAIKLGGPAKESTTTDSEGSFKLSNLAEAYDYALDISADGFDSEHYEDIVVIAGNDTNLMQLVLTPSE